VDASLVKYQMGADVDGRRSMLPSELNQET
jgi:hypothetical protein